MSGGSMDYLYQQVQAAEFKENTPERRAFRKHLDLVAEALHDIEWVDSGDYGYGDDTEAIMACINRTDVLDTTREHLAAEIERAKQVLDAD